MKRKTVLITGSSRGLGQSLALIFGSFSYNVILHGRDEKRLKKIKKNILGFGVKCDYVVGDIVLRETITNLYDKAFGGLDVLINNAAMYNIMPFGALSAKMVRAIIETNLIGPILLSNWMMHILKRKKGLIININSIAGKSYSVKEPVYCASKHGLRGFSNSIREETSRYNVGVLDVYLGAMKTSMVKDRTDYDKFIDPTEAAVAILHLVESFDTLKIKEAEIGRANY